MQTSFNRNKNSSRRLEAVMRVLDTGCFRPGCNRHCSQQGYLPFHAEASRGERGEYQTEEVIASVC